MVGIQAYFTRPSVAKELVALVSKYYPLYHFNRVLDPSGGCGNLLKAFYQLHRDAKLEMIEPHLPEKNYCQALQIGLYKMTFEEYCLTYAQPEQYDFIFANPPFNERCGDSNIGEPLCELFMPDVHNFETMFLLCCSVLAKYAMGFIIPRSYFKKEECRYALSQFSNSRSGLKRLSGHGSRIALS